jgi:glutathione S-transferase
MSLVSTAPLHSRDLMMTTVLRILNHTDIVASDDRLVAYVERCTQRRAFQHAFDARFGDFEDAE